jgi:MFS family permease
VLKSFFLLVTPTDFGPRVGVIADMWDAVGRGRAISLFATGVFLGPVLGPLVGG